MNTSENIVTKAVSVKYKNLSSHYRTYNSAEIIHSYFGEFSQERLSFISNYIEDFMYLNGEGRSLVKKMFSILIECLQNIRIHGEKDENGIHTSFLIIAQNKTSYLIAVSNLVLNSNIEEIKNKLTKIKEANENELKNKYLDTLANGIISNKGGAGLGFITMALKSNNQLSHDFNVINESLACFTLEIELNRK